jgi:hypothetical protein
VVERSSVGRKGKVRVCDICEAAVRRICELLKSYGEWYGFQRGKRARERENRGSGSEKGWVGLSWGGNGPHEKSLVWAAGLNGCCYHC